MAYVEPNSVIYLLKDVPLDPTYEHSIYFTGAAAQYNYFYSKIKSVNGKTYAYRNQSYQRVNRGSLRIEEKADNLYDCNYLMFQNTNHGNKWFYAFIKEVNYLNENTTQIDYEIDDLQTWWGETHLKECFVEREHVNDDTIGLHTLPEQVEIGSYVYDTSLTDYGHASIFNNNGSNWSIVIVATCTLNQQQEIVRATGRMYGKMYTGLAFNRFASASAANAFIDSVTQDFAYGEDAILAIFMVPDEFFVGGDASTNWHGYGLTKAYTWTITRGNTSTQPKNNKLYTYPYNMLLVTTSEGNSAEYRYEYFAGANASVGIRGSISTSPQAQLVPMSYKGLSYAYNEQLLINSFPFCTYITDAFKAWLALNSTKETWAIGTGILDTVNDVLGIVANPSQTGVGVASQAVGALSNAAHRAESIVVPHVVASTMPPHAKGQSSNVMDMQMGTFGYWFYNAHVRNEYAVVIDDYFSMYGYACHRIKIPNRNVRYYWTYTKTCGCVLAGDVPADSARKICSIYDNGITFWRYVPGETLDVGNYERDNTILT